MRKYWIFLIIVVLTPIVIIGALVLKNCYWDNRLQEVYLNTAEMKEADTTALGRGYNKSIIESYIFSEKKPIKLTKAPADIFICTFFKDSLKKSADTVVFIDTQLRSSREEKISERGFEIKETQKMNGCDILIPKYQIPLLRKYSYKYANVLLERILVD